MKFALRFAANSVALYLALYLVDSVARGGFSVGAIWAAILLALVLSLVNSAIRPLHRLRTRTVRAVIVSVLTLVVNALVVQAFAWATPLSIATESWLVLVTIFISVLCGVLNWLIGFRAPAKPRPTARIGRSTQDRSAQASRGRGRPPSRPSHS